MPLRSVHHSPALSLPLMVAAVAAGALAGLFIAPATGAATRARLRSLAADAGSRLRRHAGAMYERLPPSRRPGGVRRRAYEATPPAALTASIGEITSATQHSQPGATS
jgi:hypothetical protein